MQQGFAEAVLCHVEGDGPYITKRAWSGRQTLINEWIAGRIGLELGLPIPRVDMLKLDVSVARYMNHPNALDLAAMPAFGSSYVDNVIHLPVTSVVDVAPELRARILLFDWWVVNRDRSEWNINLLWSARHRQLHVIDHNNAFCERDLATFWDDHVFRADRPLWGQAFRAETEPLMQRILANVTDYWSELPDEWIDPPCDTTPELVDRLLRRMNDAESFWGVP